MRISIGSVHYDAAHLSGFGMGYLGALTLPAIQLPNGVVGQPYAPTKIQASGFSGSVTGWSMPSGKYPDGLGAGSGGSNFEYVTLQGTPTSAGTFNFTIKVTDASGASATQSYTVVITCPSGYVDSGLSGLGYRLGIGCASGLSGKCVPIAVTQPPPITLPTLSLPAMQLPNGVAGQPYQATPIIAVGYAGSVVGWSMSSGLYPPGITGPSGGSNFEHITLQGTPTEAGVYNFTIVVQDSAGRTAQQSYSITIICPSGYVDSGMSGLTGVTISGLQGLTGKCVSSTTGSTAGSTGSFLSTIGADWAGMSQTTQYAVYGGLALAAYFLFFKKR